MKSRISIREIVFGGVCLVIGLAVGSTVSKRTADVGDRSWAKTATTGSLASSAGEQGIRRNIGTAIKRIGKDLDDPATGYYESYAKLSGFTEGFGGSDFETAITESLEIEDFRQRSRLLAAIFERWIQAAPEEAANRALSLRQRDRESVLNSILPLWVGNDYSSALRWMEGRTTKELGKYTGRSVLRTIAKIDPAKALELLEKNDFFAENTQSRGKADIAYAWAESEPETAANFALSIGDANERISALSNVASKWGAKNFESAWKWGLGLEDVKERATVAKSLLAGLVRKDPEQGVNAFKQIDDPLVAREVVDDVARYLADHDPEMAYRYALEEFPEALRTRALQSVIQTWAGSDPEAGFNIALTDLPLGESRTNSISFSLGHLAQRNFDRAIELLDEIEPPSTRDVVLSTLTYQLVESDPEKSHALAESLPGGEAREDLFARIAREMVQNDPEAAAQYSMAHVTSERNGINSLNSVLREWATSDPAESIRWTIQNTSDAMMERAIPGLAGQWVDIDPDGAVEWAAELPEDPVRTRVFTEIVSRLTRSDLAAAADFLERLPKSGDRDEAIKRFSSTASRSDPIAALAWAGEISNVDARNSSLQQVAAEWYRNQPAAAERWLRSSSLPKESIKQILGSN